ncbi:MAG: fibronectin type III domain-containing protein, partial [Flammeovirgaceae bacterium]
LEDSNQTTITNGTSASLDGNVTDSGAAYVFKRIGSNWVQEAYLKASNADSGDYFGFDTAIAGDTIVVGAYLEDSSQITISNGSSASASNATVDAGAAYVFKRSGSNWTQEAYLKAVNVGGSDYFGYNAAISGDTIVVGAYLEDSSQTTITNGTTASADNTVTNSGAAYVFKRTANSWAQEAYLKAPSVTASDYFGFSTAISGDTIVVGAYLEDSSQTTVMNGTTVNTTNTLADSGAAYVFKRTGSTWIQEAFLKASNPTASDRFGFSTGISGDTIVVGASLEDSNQTTITNGTSASADNSIADSGAAYVFKRSGNIWAQEAYLKAAVPRASDNFGYSTSISGDTIVVGAWTEDSRETTISNAADAAGTNTAASNSGAIYVFRRPPTVGLSPTISSIVAQGSPLDGSLLSIFGSGFMKGATVSIGGVSCANPTWISYNEISCTFTSGSFQNSFLIVTNPNGNTTNAYFDPSNFVPNPKTLTATVNHNTQITLNWTSNGGSTAGFRVAYQSGSTAPSDCLTGTQLDVSGAATTSVAVTGLTRGQDYAFRLCAKDASGNISAGLTANATTGWYQEAYLKPPNPDSNDQFGISVAISGDTIVVGANGEDSSQTTITNGSFIVSADNNAGDSGAAYVFKR